MADLNYLYELSKDAQIQLCLLRALLRHMLIPPLPQAASILWHHKANAFMCQTIVQQSADARQMVEPLQDTYLFIRNNLQH